MLDRLLKRFETLLGNKSAPVLEDDESQHAPPTDEPPPSETAQETKDLEAVLLARREAQKRESRLILSERVHNRAAVLEGELRNDLLQAIHHRLDEEVQDQSLHQLLQVTLDTGFTAKLDGTIDELVERLIDKLRAEFRQDGDAEQLIPSRDGFVGELRNYRDEVLRKHLLEQVEVLALPTSAQTFSEDSHTPEELKERIARYWASCREALDKFFRSVEMALLDGAREGIRLDSTLIRDRLVAAQYRNGYRLLDERFRRLYGEIVELQMAVEPQKKKKSSLDRRVVDEIVVPLAYFIRERSEPEPREALSSRAELLREIIDKLVIVPEPFQQTAEAIKPVLRKSIEQARPIAVQNFPYLRTGIESLNPTAIHRTTALLTVFETLVRPELDEGALRTVEQVVRLDRAQYQMFQVLERSYPALLVRLGDLDRVHEEDARMITELIEQTEPPGGLIEDLFLKLGYSEWPHPLLDDPRKLLRLIAVVALSAPELMAWTTLYLDEPPSREERARLAQILSERLGPTSIGACERERRLKAVPLPIDLNKALGAIGYRPDARNRLEAFREELCSAIETGGVPELSEAIDRIRRLHQAVQDERAQLGATRTDAEPYSVEIWLTDAGTMLGLVLFSESGFGVVPVEQLSRDPGPDGNRKETEEQLRRSLQNQAIIYQTFYKLFSRRTLLPKDRRRALPCFVKKLYEPTEPNRMLLLSRLRYAKELVTRMEAFSKLIAEASPETSHEVKAVLQILSGLGRKVTELSQTTEKSRNPAELGRLVREYERALKYLNTVVVHAVNPWLTRQTEDLATEFEFDRQEVEQAVRSYVSQYGLDWSRDVEGFEAHGIRGTLGCRALLKLVDGSSKVVLLNYDRHRQIWQVRHMGARVTDVVREALLQNGRTLPEDYDEKYEQPTFSLDEQSCRFLLVKRNRARVEATLVLDTARGENRWNVVYLKYNDEVLVDRVG